MSSLIQLGVRKGDGLKLQRSVLLTGLLYLAVSLLEVVSATESILQVCTVDVPYPPFIWSQLKPDGRTELNGICVTLLHHALDHHGQRFQISLLPEARCLREVKDGNRFSLVLSASKNAERERQYFISDSYGEVHLHAFYSKTYFPSGPPVKIRTDLLKYRVCGMYGHNFSIFGISPEKIDMGSTNFPSVIAKLQRGRCDVFPYNVEVVESYRLIGSDLLADPDVAHEAIADMQPFPLHMLVSRHYADAAQLLQWLDDDFNSMRNSGELQALYDNALHKP